MKTPNFKITILLLFAFASGFSQVGIGNTNPKATLDVTATNPTGTSTSVDGITLPSVTRQRAQSMTAANISASTMIYVNEVVTGTATGITANVTTVGIYYWDGSLWQSIKGTSGTKTSINQFYSLSTQSGYGSNMSEYGFYYTGYAPATTGVARYYLAGGADDGIFYAASAMTATNITLTGWATSPTSNATATIYIVKYSLGTTATAYTNTVTGTTLGSQAVTINGGNMNPVSISVGSTALAAGDVIVGVIVNTTGSTRTLYFGGQLDITQ